MNPIASTWIRRDTLAVPHALLLSAYALACVLLWSIMPLAAHWDVPVDNLEQLAWVLTPDWGYPKHPPFPTWVLWGFEQVFPHGIALTYLLGALQVAMMMAIAWRLARETLGARRALVTVLPMQDILRLGSDARLNLPGTVNGNWVWRFSPDALSPALAGQYRELNALYGRLGT